MIVRNTSRLRGKFKYMFSSYSFKINEAITKIKNYETAEKIKGTFLERWGNYWKNLYIDYKDVAIDIRKDCKARPIRTSVYVSGICYYLCKHNPDEQSFRERLLQDGNKIIQVGKSILNPTSMQHIRWLEEGYNQGIVRRLNLGIISVIWLDNYDKTCSLYKAVCPYLKPRYLTFYERIVDIGFLDKWWLLENKMIDYDINEEEFQHLEENRGTEVYR